MSIQPFVFTLILWCSCSQLSTAQNVSISSNGSEPDSSAMLDIVSTDKGMLVPRTDTAAVNAGGVTLAQGLLIYQSSDNRFYFYNGTKWQGIHGPNDDNQQIDVLNLSGTTLQLSLEDDGVATQTVDLSSLTNIDEIKDADQNTKIQVEEGTNDNIIRFDLNGTEHFRMNSGRLEVVNTGNSVFIGESAGAADDLGDNRNNFIGLGAGKLNTSGNNNVAVGYAALTTNTSGVSNVAIGNLSLQNSTTASTNVGIGYQALNTVTTSGNNVGVGYQALRTTTGSQNTAIGYEAGEFNTSSTNTFLGYRAGYSSGSGASNVFLGYRAGESETGSNKLYIANSSTTSPLIYGEFDNGLIRLDGNVDVDGTLDIWQDREVNFYNGSGSTFRGFVGPGLNGDVTLESEVSGRWLRIGATNSNIAFFTDGNASNNSNPQVVIDAAGEVGIGTSSPSTALDVNGEIRIRGGSPAAGDALVAEDANGNAGWSNITPDIGYTQTTGATTYSDADNFRQVTNTVSVVVETGDLVKIEGQVVARLTSGSNDDEWGLKAVRSGSCGSADENLIEFTPSEDNDDDHSNFRPYSYLDFYQATCNGTVSFSLYLRNTGDDNWQVEDRTLIVTVFRQ